MEDTKFQVGGNSGAQGSYYRGTKKEAVEMSSQKPCRVQQSKCINGDRITPYNSTDCSQPGWQIALYASSNGQHVEHEPSSFVSL